MSDSDQTTDTHKGEVHAVALSLTLYLFSTRLFKVDDPVE